MSVRGKLPVILQVQGEEFITTTIFVKYNYAETERRNALRDITMACLPNGILQERYNPDAENGIWIAGRNAPSRGEEFRVRLSFACLQEKASWRVQKIPLPPHDFHWQD